MGKFKEIDLNSPRNFWTNSLQNDETKEETRDKLTTIKHGGGSVMVVRNVYEIY